MAGRGPGGKCVIAENAGNPVAYALLKQRWELGHSQIGTTRKELRGRLKSGPATSLRQRARACRPKPHSNLLEEGRSSYQVPAMNRRPLGKTNLLVSEIGVGAWQLGGPLLLDGVVDGHPELGREYCVRLIRDAGELGINFVDTAEQYGNGESERRVGEALEGRRDQWILGTKFGAQVGPSGERVNDASPARVPVSIEGSLRRLRTDYIDLYVYHTAPKPEEAELVAGILQQAKKAGKVRAVGISTNDLQHVEYLHSLGCLDVVQYAKNIMTPHRDLSDWVAQHQVGGVVRGAFYGGRLSGRYFHQAASIFPRRHPAAHHKRRRRVGLREIRGIRGVADSGARNDPIGPQIPS